MEEKTGAAAGEFWQALNSPHGQERTVGDHQQVPPFIDRIRKLQREAEGPLASHGLSPGGGGRGHAPIRPHRQRSAGNREFGPSPRPAGYFSHKRPRHAPRPVRPTALLRAPAWPALARTHAGGELRPTSSPAVLPASLGAGVPAGAFLTGCRFSLRILGPLRYCSTQATAEPRSA